MSVILSANGVKKHYGEGKLRVDVLTDINLAVEKGQTVAIVGASGSGKSTLLHLLGGLDTVDQGEITVDGRNLLSLGDKERGDLRNQCLGFVYQFHHLLAEFSARENVAMPLLIRGEPRERALEAASLVLETVGLGKRLLHRPGEMSGGERQRTAIARAMVTGPKCILADEPTGNLDRKTADSVFSSLMDLKQEKGTAIVMVTHDHSLAERMDSVLWLEDGSLTAAR